MQDPNFPYIIALHNTKKSGLGVKRISKIIQQLDNLEEFWNANEHDLLLLNQHYNLKLPTTVLQNFALNKQSVNIQELLDNLEYHQVQAIHIHSDKYPQQLYKLDSPPIIIYVKGVWDISWFDQAISIVGTRNITSYAEQITYKLSNELAQRNFTVITGMAKGVDNIASQGAIAVPNSRCVAVVANGVDSIIPYSNKPIYDILATQGCILSEYPLGTKPERGYFPARNRIIAALGQATLIPEAGDNSGSLITAQFAKDLNKQVFCLAGHINNNQNQGCHKWIRKGYAKLIISVEDILEELNCPDLNITQSQPAEFVQQTMPILAKPQPQLITPDLNEKETKIFDYLKSQPEYSSTFDKLIDNTNLSVNIANATIIKLVLRKILHKTDNNIQLIIP